MNDSSPRPSTTTTSAVTTTTTGAITKKGSSPMLHPGTPPKRLEELMERLKQVCIRAPQHCPAILVALEQLADRYTSEITAGGGTSSPLSSSPSTTIGGGSPLMLHSPTNPFYLTNPSAAAASTTNSTRGGRGTPPQHRSTTSSSGSLAPITSEMILSQQQQQQSTTVLPPLRFPNATVKIGAPAAGGSVAGILGGVGGAATAVINNQTAAPSLVKTASLVKVPMASGTLLGAAGGHAINPAEMSPSPTTTLGSPTGLMPLMEVIETSAGTLPVGSHRAINAAAATGAGGVQQQQQQNSLMGSIEPDDEAVHEQDDLFQAFGVCMKPASSHTLNL